MPKIIESKCPYCGHKLNGATHPKDPELLPREGDLSLCVTCGGFLQYNKDLSVIEMCESVWDDIDQETFTALITARKHIIERGELQ